MRSATSSGWLIIATCELSISTVVEPARAAMARSAAGGMTRSDDATRYQDGSVFHAGGPDGSPRVASAAGRCETAMIGTRLRGQVLAERLREDVDVQVGVARCPRRRPGTGAPTITCVRSGGGPSLPRAVAAPTASPSSSANAAM